MTDPIIPGAVMLDADTLSANMQMRVDTVSPRVAATTLGNLAEYVGRASAVTTGITAHAGGGQTSATQLDQGINNVTTVATAADSVKLPAAVAGNRVTVTNSAAANAMQVFGYGTDTINSIATATGVSQLAGTTVTYVCYVAGNWIRPTVQQAYATLGTTNPATQRNVFGQITLNFAGVVTIGGGTGSVAGTRGEISVAAGTTAKDGFYYGAQGKITMPATAVMDQTSATRMTGVLGQLDVNGATLTAGQISAVWADMGATGPVAWPAESYIVRASNTTAGAVNGHLFTYGKAAYWAVIGANGGAFLASATGGLTPSGNAVKMKVNIDGADYYILAAATYS